MRKRSVSEYGSPLPLTRDLESAPAKQSDRGLSQSKTRRWFATLYAFVMLPLMPAFAQSFSIDWHTIDGGGGTSTGGVYQVSGTVGQPNAGPTMSGATFSVSGGFWSPVTVVQTVGAPTLTLTLTSTNTAVVSWPFPSMGFTLQQNTNLNTPDWVLSSQTVTNSGAVNYIIVNEPTGNCFYRLIKP